MICFSHNVIDKEMLCEYHLELLATAQGVSEIDDTDDKARQVQTNDIAIQRDIVSGLAKYFRASGFVIDALDYAAGFSHIMDFDLARALNTLFTLTRATIRHVLDYNARHSDFTLSAETVELYSTRRLLLDVIWSFTGDSGLEVRGLMGEHLRTHSGIDVPAIPAGGSLIDFDVEISSGEWVYLQSRIPIIEVETHAILSAGTVIPTIDTVRHEEVLYNCLADHRPLLLCGPPGSGKTMTLLSALRKLPNLDVVGLNFSSSTTPDLILKTFEQYCEYRKSPSGTSLAPPQIGRWLVLFCDEINLPALDKYGTQRVISFLRQLVENNGFWRTNDFTWVTLERIQFVGACNPPGDPGRIPLSHRFLRHTPIILVDHPSEGSLKQIYGTFNKALLKLAPNLRGYSESLTNAMVKLYITSAQHFTADIQAHYIYSPRELTRWSRGIYESIKPHDTLSVSDLLRIWAHEALRLFQDRLIRKEEKAWTDHLINDVAAEHFPNIKPSEALVRPILFSNWTSRHYISVDREQLREYTKARLRVFYEEELDVPLVLFDDVLDHVLRIDRVFRQVQGHCLLIGVSGGGKVRAFSVTLADLLDYNGSLCGVDEWIIYFPAQGLK